MKTDPKSLPQMMAGKKAILTVKHLTKDDEKMKLLAFYQVYFAINAITDASQNTRTKPRKANRNRTLALKVSI